jgi:hypothetical protein
MASRLPLVVIAGQVQQLPAGDTVSGAVAGDPAVGSFAPGGFSLVTGQYAMMVRGLILTGSQQVALAGTSCLRIL